MHTHEKIVLFCKSQIEMYVYMYADPGLMLKRDKTLSISGNGQSTEILFIDRSHKATALQLFNPFLDQKKRHCIVYDLWQVY